MDQLVPAIRQRTQPRRMEQSHTPSFRTGIRVRELQPVVARDSSKPVSRVACVGSCDTPVDPLQLVWLVERDRLDFVNF